MKEKDWLIARLWELTKIKLNNNFGWINKLKTSATLNQTYLNITKIKQTQSSILHNHQTSYLYATNTGQQPLGWVLINWRTASDLLDENDLTTSAISPPRAHWQSNQQLSTLIYRMHTNKSVTDCKLEHVNLQLYPGLFKTLHNWVFYAQEQCLLVLGSKDNDTITILS